MVVLVWILFGTLAGLFASRRFHHTGNVLVLDVTLGIAGAIAGALATNSLGFPQPTAFLVAGLFGAVAGAVVTLAGYRSIFRGA